MYSRKLINNLRNTKLSWQGENLPSIESIFIRANFKSALVKLAFFTKQKQAVLMLLQRLDETRTSAMSQATNIEQLPTTALGSCSLSSWLREKTQLH